jgi:choline-glycine betaine transporter
MRDNGSSEDRVFRSALMAKDETSAAASASDLALEVAIPLREIVPWAIFGVVMMALAYYFVGAEQGATSVFGGMGIHEFVHDARHLLGFPCH